MSKKKRERPDPRTLGLPFGGVDSHAHLEMDVSFAEDFEEVLARARESGVAAIGNVFLGPAAYHANRHLFDGHPEIYFLCGVHPNDTGKAAPGDLAALEAAFRADPRLKAVGEIGLDYYWKQVPDDVQQKWFADQLDLARALDKPVVIHSRDAEADALAMLLDQGFADRPVLWHCYGGDAALALRIMELGWLLSVPGSVTYAKNDRLPEAVAAAYAARGLSGLLVETDCPFLAPEPWRGKRNEPAFVGFTAARVAAILDLPVAQVWQATGDNARKFFGLDEE